MSPRLKAGLGWALAAAASIAAHGCAMLILSPDAIRAESDAGSPVALLELAPVAVAPQARSDDVEPGPPQADSEKRDRIDAQNRHEQQDKPDPAPPDPSTTEPEQAPPKPAPAETLQQAPRDDSMAMAPPDAARHADRIAAPAAGGAIPNPSAADLRWQSRMVARLERAKRYPREALGRAGVAKVLFRIDRNGRLLTSEIVESSGSAALDAATLTLLKQAEPFPPPPRDLADDRLVFIAPIRYLASASSR